MSIVFDNYLPNLENIIELIHRAAIRTLGAASQALLKLVAAMTSSLAAASVLGSPQPLLVPHRGTGAAALGGAIWSSAMRLGIGKPSRLASFAPMAGGKTLARWRRPGLSLIPTRQC